MQRSTRNQAFASSRQKSARKLIHELTNLGISITEISKRTKIASSTISKWFIESCPNPRTLSKLEFLKDKIISENTQKNRLQVRDSDVDKWQKAGGLTRVHEFAEWQDENAMTLRNDHPKFQENFAHWEIEKDHKAEGKRLGFVEFI